jgi:hypothetical protein
MKIQSVIHHYGKNKRGATIIIVALVLFTLLAFIALSIDLGHLYVARNELQNAADAAALAGAQDLYNDEGTEINAWANQTAYDIAVANKSEQVPVEVNWTSGNDGDVQRGHWSFGLSDLPRGFYPNESTAPFDLWNISTEELDAEVDFINAVKVVSRRQATPVASFFSRIFGHESFELSADAVAYLGFAGTLLPEDVDQPIAICKQSILIDGVYSCNMGRMINSGQDPENADHNTAGWTSFNQDDPCTGGTNAQELKSLVDYGCAGGGANDLPITLGDPIATQGGEVQSAFSMFVDCWISHTNKETSWQLTLPVIDCDGNNVTTCQDVRGAVTINIVWICEKTDPHYYDVPTHMECGQLVWDNDNPDGAARWDSFVSFFNLKDVNGNEAPYDAPSIYFLPDCTPHIPVGTSGGENFGILAEIPVLVE